MFYNNAHEQIRNINKNYTSCKSICQVNEPKRKKYKYQ